MKNPLDITGKVTLVTGGSRRYGQRRKRLQRQVRLSSWPTSKKTQ